MGYRISKQTFIETFLQETFFRFGFKLSDSFYLLNELIRKYHRESVIENTIESIKEND